MLAGRYNFVCDQGSTFQRTIDIKNAEGEIFPLTGYTARMHVRREIDSTSTLIELTTTNSRLTINGALGRITMSLTPTETAAITRSGYYDLEIVETATGKVHKVLRGEFRLEKEVTR